MKVSDLRGILQYVPRFREKIFVIFQRQIMDSLKTSDLK